MFLFFHVSFQQRYDSLSRPAVFLAAACFEEFFLVGGVLVGIEAEYVSFKLIVVLGHDHCGAVDAAINHDPEGYIKFITDEIKLAIGSETNDYKACCLNVRHSIEMIESSFEIHREEKHGLRVVGALYRLEDGVVEFEI